MRRKRLCFVVESGTDVRLVEGLAERFDLTILARRIEGGVEISRQPEAAVAVTVGPASRLRFASLVFRHLLANRRRIDSVLVQGYALAALAANVASRLTGAHTAMLVCSPVEAYYRCRKEAGDASMPFRSWELAGLVALARLNARIGRRYVVLSQHLAQTVRSHGGRRPVDVAPVYGVDTYVFRPASETKSEIRRRRGLPETGQLVFFSSRVAPEKDTETLLAAVRLLVDAGRDVRLLNRSGGYARLGAVASRLGLAERVIVTDAVHPLRELPLDYQACDLCVQASREEGLGFSPLEALASGLPVVASAVGGLRETIREDDTGWIYPRGDAGALARAMATALDNPSEAARRAAAGRAMVIERFAQRLVFDRLEDLLNGR